ncbi:MAG: U32 family peptidase, partial [Hydrogenoanaerobacterium sp.]
MSNIIRPEVLSPAGDMERLRAAVLFGADAVYLGGKELGMRASPLNFTDDELCEAVIFAHQNGVKVYLTCNTVPTND